MLKKYMNMQLHQLERMNKEVEVRAARVENIEIRNKWLRAQKIKNYPSEYDRIRAHMDNSVLPYVETRKVRNCKAELERLGARAFDTMRN